MSGNPFRRQPTKELQSTGDSVESSQAFEDAIRSAFQGIKPLHPCWTKTCGLQLANRLSDSGRKASTTKKTVRIQTPPPLSPDPVSPEEGNPLIRRVSNEEHTGSPPPQSPVDGASATGSGQLEPSGKRLGEDVVPQDAEVINNTRRNSESASIPSSSTTSIVNPFQKTLATLEPRDRGLASDAEQKSSVSGADKTSSRHGAGPLDVNGFAKMLMTGKGPLPSTHPQSAADLRSRTSNATPGDSRSTETSSMPRQTTTKQNSEVTVSSSDTSSDDGSPEQTSSRAYLEQAANTKPSKPPLPKHRHGKVVDDRRPATVSFDDFESTPAEEPDRTTGMIDQSSLPRRQSPSPMSRPIVSRSASSSEILQKIPSEGGLETRRAPPPAPLSRRTTGPHPSKATERPHSQSPLPSPGLSNPTSQHQGKATKAPPPPPARRGTNRNSLPPDQMSSSDVTLMNSETTSLADEYGPIDSTTARKSLNAMPGSSRSSSFSERSSAPPPPPPRRGRVSSKSSMDAPPHTRSPNDSRRISGEYNRPGSTEIPQRVSSLSQVSENDHDSGQPNNNVLADLSALQAEVEALRYQYRRPS